MALTLNSFDKPYISTEETDKLLGKSENFDMEKMAEMMRVRTIITDALYNGQKTIQVFTTCHDPKLLKMIVNRLQTGFKLYYRINIDALNIASCVTIKTEQTFWEKWL